MSRKIIFFIVLVLWVAGLAYVACDYNKENMEGTSYGRTESVY